MPVTLWKRSGIEGHAETAAAVGAVTHQVKLAPFHLEFPTQVVEQLPRRLDGSRSRKAMLSTMIQPCSDGLPLFQYRTKEWAEADLSAGIKIEKGRTPATSGPSRRRPLVSPSPKGVLLSVNHVSEK